MLGNPTVTVPELSPTSTSLVVPANVIVPPKAVAVELDPSETVIVELANLLLAIAAVDLISALTIFVIVLLSESIDLLVNVSELEAVIAPISLSTSAALLPSTAVQSILRKSLSATPLVNCAILLLLIPTSKVETVPKPKVVL